MLGKSELRPFGTVKSWSAHGAKEGASASAFNTSMSTRGVPVARGAFESTASRAKASEGAPELESASDAGLARRSSVRWAARDSRWTAVCCIACLCMVLEGHSAAWGQDPRLDRYHCFELLQRIHAGSAVGGVFQGIGELYFLPGSKGDEPGLYVLNADMCRFVTFGAPPSKSKDDFILIVEILSYREYAFAIRFQGPGSRFEKRGWSIENAAGHRNRPKNERRVRVLIGGRDPGAMDAVTTEIRAAIPYLSDHFDAPFTEDLHPILSTFARDFYSTFQILLECTREIAEGDQELQVLAALEQVELLRCLDRAVHNVIRNEQDPRWRQDLEVELAEEICRRISCWEDEQRLEARHEAQRLVEEFGELQRLIASVRATHGEKWEKSLLRQLLQEGKVDSVAASAVLEHE